jgi:hypothetical protein
MVLTYRKLKDEDVKYYYGSYLPVVRDEVCINVYDIWDSIKNDNRIKKKNREKKFIEKFNKIVVHEFIHQEIYNIMYSLYVIGEEKIVEKITRK